MQLGMIGLGRMGANMVRRLMADGHECVVWDPSADAVQELAGEGAVARRRPPRTSPPGCRRRARSGSWSPPASSTARSTA